MDVLIVGACLAGYMTAVTLARYNVNFRIIDKRASPVQTSHASGLQPLTQETFHTMRIANKLSAQASQLREMAFLGPLSQMEGQMSGAVSMELPSQGLIERAWESRLRVRRRICVHVPITGKYRGYI
jgi:2-polyprenyl-6-methoxyphenol hydroxylase-like FAD-dependent oxidoreductase